MAGAAVRVVVVDDSRLMRELLSTALSQADDIQVVGVAADPYEAREVIRATDPDVVTLDVEMPNMGGLEFLRLIMKLRPTPVVMVAGSTTSGAETTLTALEIGAVDFVAKPSGGRAGWGDFGATVRYKVREAAKVRFGPAAPRASAAADTIRAAVGPDQGRAAAARKPALPGVAGSTRCELIAIGASTGGVSAISRMMADLPPDLPPIVIAQHMPPTFTGRFAARLARATGFDVAEASEGEVLRPGVIRIAPGDHHLRLARRSDGLATTLGSGAPVSGHRPSIDVLFNSVAELVGARAVGVLLTGMGSDGARGLARMRSAGAHTLAEAEESCVVYGMPKAAMRLGAVAEQLPIDRIAESLCSRVAGARHPH